MVGRQTEGRFAEGVKNAPAIAALTAGQVAGGINDIAGEGLVSAYRSIVPEEARKGIEIGVNYLAQTAPGKTIGNALQGGKEAYGKFSTAYPDAAMALEGAGNIVGLAYGAKGGESVVPRATPEKIAKQYSSVVQKGIEKSIRPGVEGKRTFSQAKRYFSDAEKAVTSIIDNAPNLNLTDDLGEAIMGQLPKNLKQFSQAVEQTKGDIFNRYNAMAKEAGKQGAVVELTPIADELANITKSKPLADVAPETVSYAMKRAESLAGRGAYTAEEAQEAISILNNSLESFYKTPTYDSFSKAYIDKQIANHMRKSLDNVIENTTEAGYQGLKREYGALKSIERDLNRRVVVASRQNAKGLAEGFTDALSGGAMINGLLSMNPAMVGQAAAMKGISAWVKFLNNPDNVVKKMFSKAADIKSRLPVTPAPTGPAGIAQLENLAEGQRQIPYFPQTRPPQQGPFALPPGQGFEMLSDADVSQRAAQSMTQNALGGKNINGFTSGGITRQERIRQNALSRGLTQTNPKRTSTTRSAICPLR